MEPLTFKILTDADDSGIQRVNKGMDSLNINSKKAGNALKSFSRDALEAKSGADLAAAGANALSQVIQKSLVGTAVLGGAKLITDQINRFSVAIKEVATNTMQATQELERMGQPRNLEEALRGVDVLNKSLDASKNKLGEINSSNWFSKTLAGITGTTAEIEEQIKTMQRLIDVQIAFGFETEKKNREAMQGLSGEDLLYKQIELRLEKNLELTKKITDENLRKGAVSAANSLAEMERADIERAREKKSLENLNEVIRDRAKAELKVYEIESKARQDAQKIFENFEAEKEKAHQEELKRSAERIGAIQDEITAIKERGETLRKNLVEAGGDIAMLGAAAFGSGRGPGQRMTSGEVGTRRNVQRAEQEATRQAGLEARQEAKERILEREGPDADTSGYAITRELDAMATELAKQKALSPVEDYKKLKKQTEENNKALSKSTDELKDAQKAQEGLNKQTEENKATFEGVDYSVNQMGSNADMVSDALGGLSGSIGSLSDTAKSSLKDVDGLGAAAESANKYLSSLATEASNLENIFATFGEMDITTINTDSIVLN